MHLDPLQYHALDEQLAQTQRFQKFGGSDRPLGQVGQREFQITAADFRMESSRPHGARDGFLVAENLKTVLPQNGLQSEFNAVTRAA